MGRSGTSALSKSLTTLEINIGDSFIPPVNGVNPKGFWEDKDIYDLNNKILNFLKMNWSSLSPISQNQINILKNKNFLTKAVKLLNAKLKNHNTFAFKEPRVTKLLPFWILVFKKINAEVSYLIALRNPISVAESLYIRDKYDRIFSSLVWFDFTSTSLYYTNNEKRIIINYDDLITKPHGTLNRISKFLGQKINPVLKKEFISEFLDPKLRNNFYTIKDLKKSFFPESTINLYTDLIKLDQSKINNKDIKFLFEVYRKKYLENTSIYSLIDNANLKINQLMKDKSELKSNILKFNNEILNINSKKRTDI